VLVVVAIIGILSLVTVPNFISMYQSSRIKGAARGLTTAIRNARQLAIAGNQRTKFSFNTVGTGRRNYIIAKEMRDPLTDTKTWQNVRTGDLGERVEFTDSPFLDAAGTDDGGLRDVIFLPNGTIGNLPVDPDDYWIDISTDLNIPKKTYRLKFTISGNVTLS
jgi:type II secretory pathway pseudopilin PulG